MNKPITPEEAAKAMDKNIQEEYDSCLKAINEKLENEWHTGRINPVCVHTIPKHKKSNTMLKKAFEEAGWLVKVEANQRDGTSWVMRQIYYK
jgi:hypothetical protein